MLFNFKLKPYTPIRMFYGFLVFWVQISISHAVTRFQFIFLSIRSATCQVSTMCNLASLMAAQGESELLLGAEALLKDAIAIDPKSFTANSLLAQVSNPFHLS